MLRFHENGAEAGNGGFGFETVRIRPGVLWKKAHGKFGESEMEVEFGNLVKYELSEGRRGLRSGGADGPEEDVELGRSCWCQEEGGCGEEVVKSKSCGVAAFEALGEDTA
jgi:hypothetical protein